MNLLRLRLAVSVAGEFAADVNSQSTDHNDHISTCYISSSSYYSNDNIHCCSLAALNIAINDSLWQLSCLSLCCVKATETAVETQIYTHTHTYRTMGYNS